MEEHCTSCNNPQGAAKYCKSDCEAAGCPVTSDGGGEAAGSGGEKPDKDYCIEGDSEAIDSTCDCGNEDMATEKCDPGRYCYVKGNADNKHCFDEPKQAGAGSGSGGEAPAPPSSAEPANGGVYRLVNVHSGRALF